VNRKPEEIESKPMKKHVAESRKAGYDSDVLSSDPLEACKIA
jgi:hypothetical protein